MKCIMNKHTGNTGKKLQILKYNVLHILTDMHYYVFLGVSCFGVHSRLSETLKGFPIWDPCKQLPIPSGVQMEVE